MKRRFFILLIFSILLLIGFFLWKSPSVEEESLRSDNGQREKVTTYRQRRATENGSASNANAGHPDNAAPPANPPTKLSKAEQIEYAIRNANHPIRFYGKVIDQNNLPISGVKIRMRYTELQTLGTLHGESNQPVDLTTDANGHFELTGVKGMRIAIESVTKSGYQLSAQAPRSSGLQIDPASPVIFRMWKRQGADRLVGAYLSRQAISVEGVPTTFDLFQGKKNSGTPDLKVTLVRTLVHILRGTNRFDWTATLEIADGGFLATQDEFPFQASEEGYQSRLVFEFKKEDEDWLPHLRQQFYIRACLQI